MKQENLTAFKRQLVEDVRALPGIENATATNNVPLSGDSWGHTVDVGALNGPSKFTYVSPTYFATMGIPILTGRGFTEQDRSDAPYVLIVNQAFIRAICPDFIADRATCACEAGAGLSGADVRNRGHNSRYEVWRPA